jgi:nitrite reductase/ring-hydroxylating ferredoxin subunit
MIRVGKKLVLLINNEGHYFATEALCRHMRWPLAIGGKVKDGCIRCPLHQTTHKIDDGSLVEWSIPTISCLWQIGWEVFQAKKSQDI